MNKLLLEVVERLTMYLDKMSQAVKAMLTLFKRWDIMRGALVKNHFNLMKWF